MTPKDPLSQQRVDKWLWYTRVFKSRSLASKFVDSGKVRVTRGAKKERLSKSSQNIQVGDVLTFSVHERVRVLKVVETGTRRGPASEAQALYEDFSPEVLPRRAKDKPIVPSVPTRDKGAGRPTKRERRAIDQMQGSED